MDKPLIQKLGTIDLDTVESNPVVFKGVLYRFEYIRNRYHANLLHDSYFRFVNVETGEAGVPFAAGLHMGNAFAWQDKMYVTAVEDWGKSRFYQLESDDLTHWTSPRVILEGQGWRGYNTSVCRDGNRFLLTFELGAPAELVGEHPFTMLFAESQDLHSWNFLPDKHFDKDMYTGGPAIRSFAGWRYFFYLHAYPDGCGKTVYRQHVARSRDLINWEWAKWNPILDYDERDKKPARAFSQAQLDKIKNAENINVSDLDFCQWHNGLYLVYAWGNQHGTEFLAEAKVDNMTEQQFCESWF